MRTVVRCSRNCRRGKQRFALAGLPIGDYLANAGSGPPLNTGCRPTRIQTVALISAMTSHNPRVPSPDHMPALRRPHLPSRIQEVCSPHPPADAGLKLRVATKSGWFVGAQTSSPPQERELSPFLVNITPGVLHLFPSKTGGHVAPRYEVARSMTSGVARDFEIDFSFCFLRRHQAPCEQSCCYL
jgi:hypothetical protein